MQRRFFLLLCLPVLLIGCKRHAASPTADNGIPIDDTLRQALAAYVEQRQPAEHLGLLVYDLTADKPVYAYREKALMPPASCMKLLTGLAALHLMGSHYAYTTQIKARGLIQGATLHGNVALVGSLDPLFHTSDLPMFIKPLKKKGIRALKGRFYLDLASHRQVQAEEHWYPWDLELGRYGLFYRDSAFVMHAVRNALKSQGIAVADSSFCFSPAPADLHTLFRLKRDMGLTLNRVWKNSSNTLCTGLLYTIGHETSPTQPDMAAGGIGYLHQFISEELGDTCTYVIHDGCGLCDQNRLTAQLLVELLRYGHQRPELMAKLRAHLPIAGVDGTLSHPYGISTLAGYCRGRNGHELCFAIMNKEMSVLDARPMQERLCEIMLR